MRRGPKREPPLDLHALEIFVAVIEAGSMTAAATRLGLTQPAVSAATRQLERELATELFDRSTRPLRATRAGLVLHRRATGLLNEASGLRTAVRVAGARTLPRLRIGLIVSATVTGAPLIRALQPMADELTVSSGLTPELARGLQDRDLDILVTSDAMEDVEGLERYRVLHEPFVLALPHGRKIRPDITLGALAAELPLIRYTQASIIGLVIERHLRRSGAESPARLVFDSSASVLQMVAAGLGWAVTTPLCVLQGGTDPAGLQILPLPGVTLTRDLHVVARRGELPGAAERIRDVAAGLMRGALERGFAQRAPWIVRALRY